MIRVDLVVDEELHPENSWQQLHRLLEWWQEHEEAILKNEKLLAFFFIYFLYRNHIYSDFSYG